MRSDERWRSVVGFEGLYEVSDHGRVRSVDRIRRQPIGFGSQPEAIVARRLAGRILSPATTRSGGYLSVALSNGDSGVRRFKIHQLVLAAFAGPRPAGQIPLHGDGNPKNNALGNLRYGTAAQNVADAKAHGTFCRGSRRSQAKLRESDAAAIKALVGSTSQARIARAFGVSRGCVALIARGINWPHVEPISRAAARRELDRRRKSA